MHGPTRKRASDGAERLLIWTKDVWHELVRTRQQGYLFIVVAYREVWLTKEQENGYYSDRPNAGLWPLRHVSHTRPVFDPEHRRRYRDETVHLVDEINWKYSSDTWRPLHYVKRLHSAVEILPSFITHHSSFIILNC